MFFIADINKYSWIEEDKNGKEKLTEYLPSTESFLGLFVFSYIAS